MLPSIPRNKQQLRQQCRQQRDALPADFRIQASQAICKHIRDWGIFKDADVIQTYLPMRSEVDLTPLLEEHPHKRWAIPRILPEGRMIFHPYESGRLVRHPFGMLEPAPDLPIVAPGSITLAIVPGLAFDRHGWRLGYGGGFFDRFLRDFKGTSLGVTFEALWVDSLPHNAYDIPMKFVVTEMGLNQVGRD